VITPLRTSGLLGLALAILMLSTAVSGRAADAGPNPKDVQAAVDKALVFLKKRQNEDGSFAPKLGGPGVTALIVAGLIRNGHSADEPVVANALKYLEKSVQKNGGIYDTKFANYTTSVALLALVEANTKGKYDTVIKNASKFLKTLQDDSLQEDNVKFGGVSYDAKGRPDLSNTQYFIDALLAAGVPKDDPAIKHALKFVSRCQNLPGETNDQPFAKKTSDDDKGGLTYNPVPSASEKDPVKTPQGGLRSSGVMTYAGLKTFLTAGVDKDDVRVKAAVDWVGRHYTLDENPGQKQAGLYYYYHTFGKAMHALGQDEFVDKDKKKHDWRQDLFDALKKRQREDGSWSNDKDDLFYESNPELATAFAILSLSYCKPEKK
jgi:Squalene-hopene cyclase C-terminal domain/Prenyltransferase and squalene oxidase repeat